MIKNIIYAHEHITIDLSGQKNDLDCRLDDEETALEELRELKELGVVAIVDQTNRGMGRNPIYAQKLMDSAGLKLIHATGYYKEPFLPEECYELSEEALAKIMIKEIIHGIEGTGIKASFIGEIGTSKDAITPTEEKIFRAACRAQGETGVSICTHTTLGKLGLEQLKIFRDMGGDLSKIVLSHIDLSGDLDYMLRLLDSGVNIAFDTIGKLSYMPDTDRAQWLYGLCGRGYADQIVMSVDITRKSHYRKNGGIGYSYLLGTFVPLALEEGCNESDLEKILAVNPARIYQI